MTELAQQGARWSEKLLHRRFVEVQLPDETHQFALLSPKTTTPKPTKPSQTHRLDLLVVDSGLPLRYFAWRRKTRMIFPIHNPDMRRRRYTYLLP